MTLRLRLQQLRQRLGPLWWYTLLAFIANRCGDLINIFIGLYLVPRILPGSELGALLPLISIGALFSTPLALLLLPVSKFLSAFAAHEERGKVKALLSDSLLLSLLYACGMTLWILRSSGALMERLHVTDPRLMWPIAGFAILVCIEPIVTAALRALRYFKIILIGSLLAPCVRLFSMLLLLPTLGVLGYLLAQLSTSAFPVVLGSLLLFYYVKGMGARRSYHPHAREMLLYALPLLTITLVGRIQAPIEQLVIRQRLPLIDSEGYYYAVMIGNIPSYFTNAMVPFLWPLISDRFERGLKTDKLLLQSMLFNFLIGTLFIGLFALIMPWFFTLPGPWHGSSAYAHFVWQAALIGILKTARTFYTAHETACRRFTYLWHLIPLMLLECGLLYLLPGWSVCRPWLPAKLWLWVNQHYEPTLQGFVFIIMMANIAFVAGMLLEWRLRYQRDKRHKICSETHVAP